MKIQIAGLIAFLLMSGAGLGRAADIAAGKAQSAPCAGCHGETGLSQTPETPNLAGQQAEYLIQQLKAFKEGSRKNDMMNPAASGLGAAEMANVAAYFASLKPPTGKGDPALAAKGKSKFAPCGGCHGATAGGRGPIPRLAGQRSEYTVGQLTAYQNGKRQNMMMKGAVAGLSESDLRTLAEYVATLN